MTERTIILASGVVLMWRGEIRFPAIYQLAEELGEGVGHVERAVAASDLGQLDAWGVRVFALDKNGREVPRV
jgi:hypothetical protein